HTSIDEDVGNEFVLFIVFFFFSSRRRHTRSDRDWSSDVCSSDLGLPRTFEMLHSARARTQSGTIAPSFIFLPIPVIAELMSSRFNVRCGPAATFSSPPSPRTVLPLAAVCRSSAIPRNRFIQSSDQTATPA